MKLSEALQVAGRPADPATPKRILALICSFTPLHLETFLLAAARSSETGRNLDISAGLYGDFVANLQRAAANAVDFSAVLLEWADLDPRLGLRSAGGWMPESLPSILDSAVKTLGRIEPLLGTLASRAPLALSPPTLPVPPVGHTAGWQTSDFSIALETRLGAFLERVAPLPGVRILSRQRLDEASPPATRLDPRMELGVGFPYTLSHAGALAQLLWTLLDPPTPKKGLITDLDDTLWSGILGEVGVEGVTWSMADHSQAHALYQQTLASLAASGVLVGVASKNDAPLVQEALARTDLLIPLSYIFPVHANWGSKAESVARILETWNIGVDSVILVDDSALELAEVKARFPEITALQFPPGNRADELWRLMWQLRDLCSRPQVLAEDRLRAASLRAAANTDGLNPVSTSIEFLASVEPEVTVDFRKNPEDRRAFELVNKTNQFNLNGRRFTESEWRAHLENPAGFLLTVSYQDKFGPLGRIAVALGTFGQDSCSIDAWVLSCRAFSRLVEHQMLRRLFALTAADEIVFSYCATPRNGPLRRFFSSLLGAEPVGEGLRLSRAQFNEGCTELPHRVKEISIECDRAAPAAMLSDGIPQSK
jgi:FkbH-like protein